jgi:hypothetical protein
MAYKLTFLRILRLHVFRSEVPVLSLIQGSTGPPAPLLPYLEIRVPVIPLPDNIVSRYVINSIFTYHNKLLQPRPQALQ